jgi:two-component system C4-dicarboxylate transport sensor histidine kinase DctB
MVERGHQTIDDGAPARQGQVRLSTIAAALVGALALALAVWMSTEWTRAAVLAEHALRTEQQLSLIVSGLRSELKKYELLPEVLSRNEKIVRLLESEGESRMVDEANRFLAAVNDSIGAAATYVMNRDGLTVAASNWDDPRPFVGKNFAFRPYFTEALRGETGRYFALGTTSGERGYYFARPVGASARVLGVTVVKVSLAAIEASWAGSTDVIVVTDYDGVVFITSRPEWRFRTFGRLSSEAMARIRSSRQYEGARLDPLEVVQETPFESGRPRLMTLRDDAARSAQGRAGERRFLVQSNRLEEPRWVVHVLSEMGDLRERVVFSGALALFASIIVALAGLALWQRRRNLAQQLMHQRMVEDVLRRSRADLERRVSERTAALTEANEQLDHKVVELEDAQADLRRAQDELVQAAKLAALGQMSAGISHELNQPLSAIRSFADNARVLLERERHAAVDENLKVISELTERMGQITAQLKTFARKSVDEHEAVSLRGALERVLLLLSPRAQSEGIEIDTRICEREPVVRADGIRIEQVMLNLVKNAMDAVQGTSRRLVRVEIHHQSEWVTFRVSDSGPGIPPENLGNVFEPFFTTKERGEGLGLGLSISFGIVKDHGGTIHAGSSPDGGACFSVRLPAAGGEEQAA